MADYSNLAYSVEINDEIEVTRLIWLYGPIDSIQVWQIVKLTKRKFLQENSTNSTYKN